MRYTRLSFLLVVLSVSLSFLFIPYPLWSKEVSQSSPDSDPTATRFIIGVDIVNIREQPNLSSRVKYRLKSGDSVAVKDKEGEWYRVAFEKKKNGWVHENLLATNTETTKPEATTTTPPETPSGTFSDPSDASQEYPLPSVMQWHRENPGKFVLVAEGTFLYSLSDLEGSDALSGGDIQGVISPSIQMDEKSYFSFIYNGQYYKRREFYSDDIGYLERSEYQGHTFTAQISRNFGERNRFTITPSFFYTQTLNKDGEETSWDGGLYNYRDTGWGLDFMAEDVGFAGAMGTFQIGAQIYAREYPNYDSLLDLATGLGTEKDEKDYHGVLFRTGYSWLQQAGFSWTANYSMLFKFLDDKKVVDENGLLSDDEQRDHLHTLDFNVWYLSNLGLKAGLITTLGLNKSNQNWYDGMGTVPLDDDVFIPDFYDYFVYRLRPNISYTFGAFGLFPFTATYAFAYGETLYTDRRAKYADGTYKPDEQKDKAWENFLELRYDYNRRVSFIGQFQHITNRSNNDDESFYRYNFRIYNYYAGVHLRY